MQNKDPDITASEGSTGGAVGSLVGTRYHDHCNFPKLAHKLQCPLPDIRPLRAGKCSLQLKLKHSSSLMSSYPIMWSLFPHAMNAEQMHSWDVASKGCCALDSGKQRDFSGA